MSIDSTSSSIHCKRALKSTLSQGDTYPYPNYSLNEYQNRILPKSRTMSIAEEASGDLLTDLSSLPFNSNKPVESRFTRRFSELKPSLLQKIQENNSVRRKSTPQIHLGTLLPNHFRSKKNQNKNTSKDDTHPTVNSRNNSFAPEINDMMTMKTEQPLHTRSLIKTSNGSRTNLSSSSERLSSSTYEDTVPVPLSLFTLQQNHSAPGSAGILNLQLYTPLCVAETYRTQFYDYFHTNYSGDFEQEGPFLASVRCFSNKSNPTDNNTSPSTDINAQHQARAIICTFTRNYDVSTSLDGVSDENILQSLLDKTDLPSVHSYKIIGDPKANEKIYQFDKTNDERQSCKIGVIYQDAGQTDEFDIFSNDGVSNDMSNFLKILAEPVLLKGFNKYRGDLDITHDLHGGHSYYTTYSNHEIMFNVAPIIPSSKANGQCIERKSLVGNAFVCIVFQHPNAEFSPNYISGKVTQIYITVKPCTIDEDLYYEIHIWHRNDFTTRINPSGGTYKNDESFRDYFLTLLLNSINAAIESPSLKSRVAEQRLRLKQEDLKKLLHSLSTKQNFVDKTVDIDHLHSRSDSILSIATQSTNDSINSNSGRVSPINTKKRTFSKIFSVFMGKSGSIPSAASSASLASNLTNTNSISSQSNAAETSPTQSQTNNKENDNRRASIKKHAPPPPISTGPINSLPPQFAISAQPPTPPPRTSQSFDAINENFSTQNDRFNPVDLEETPRNRSNSSPDNAQIVTKISSGNVARIKEELDSTSSSATDDDEAYDDDVSSDDDRIEHRHTLTETPLLSSSMINS